MKLFPLLSLIPYVLAYGGKPRKALPRTVPLDKDNESFGFESVWDRYGAKPRRSFPKSGILENELVDQDSPFGFELDNLRNSNGGKPRKALPKTYPLDDDFELDLPEKDSLFESGRGFKARKAIPKTVPISGDFLADVSVESNAYSNELESEEEFDRPSLQVTVPLEYNHGLKFGAFPKQEIAYQMGTKVLTDDVAVYIIYYGKWQSNQKDLLNDFTASLGESSWWNIMRKYYSQKDENSEKVYVNGKLKLANTIDDNYSMGRKLEKDAIPRLIRTHVENGFLPQDSTGIYMILTADDVQEEFRLGGAKMCRDYCGYHLTGNFSNGDIFYYAMAGRPTNCVLACGGPNGRSSPNGDPATDAMVSVIAHELAETVSDPDDEFLESRAWNDAQYMENGDMCSYKYGETQKLANGGRPSFYNYESASGIKFLVQQNWDPELQKCVSSA